MALEVRREARGSSARATTNDDDAEAVRRALNGARGMEETTT